MYFNLIAWGALITFLIDTIVQPTPNLKSGRNQPQVTAPAGGVRGQAFVGATAVDQPYTTR